MSSSPKYAIPQWVADIALEHCRLHCEEKPTVSKGIQYMQDEIDELRRDVANLLGD
jgi:hypothetical protein